MKKITFLLLMSVLLMSCKKDSIDPPESKTVGTATTVKEYHIISYAPTNDSMNVNHVIHTITVGTDLKITIPLDYNIDTMSTVIGNIINGHQSYTFDHTCKYNTQYHLVGLMYYENDSTIYLTFNQKIAPFGLTNNVASYDLTYRQKQ